jgi:hypothetical protein
MARAFGQGSFTRATTPSSPSSSTASLVPWHETSTPPAGMGATPYGLQPKPRSTCRNPPRSACASRDTVSEP